MEAIMISLAEVSRTSSQMRKYNSELLQELLEMKRIMNALATNWQSPAAETIRSRFNGMMPIFENYRNIIENYAKFLDQTVAGYEATEQTIQQSAASFQ
ncbi:WXG100 family type VII secretion target [bacterium c-19]|nr:WXG100 family type VII secretion target [bacterium c-19]